MNFANIFHDDTNKQQEESVNSTEVFDHNGIISSEDISHSSLHENCHGQPIHQSSIIIKPNTTYRSTPSNPRQGDVRLIDRAREHRQRFNGRRWVRICRIPECSRYLTGGVFYKQWACRYHYCSQETLKPKNDETISQNKTSPDNRMRTRSKSGLASQKQQTRENFVRGQIRIEVNGVRMKFDGSSWRTMCSNSDCHRLAISRGLCYLHERNALNKKPRQSLSLSSDISRHVSISTESATETIETPSLRKGDIQMVRQQWNGTKWYLLCRHESNSCTRRARGKKYHQLCREHYDEFRLSDPAENQIKPQNKTIQRNRFSSHLEKTFCTEQIAAVTTSYESQKYGIEQVVQTDFTFPVDASNLSEPCILIEENSNQDPLSHCSPPLSPIKIEPDLHLLVNSDSERSSNTIKYPVFDFSLRIKKLELG